MGSDDVTGVLFDVDGTLVDTTYLHAVCWAEALAAAGRPRITADLHHLIGMDGNLLLDAVLIDAPASAQLREEVTSLHGELYRAYWPGLRPLPGARQLLEHCHDAGLTVVLSSSAAPEELEALRAALDADQWVHAATSAKDGAQGKPSPDLVHAALQAGELTADQALFVGDAVWDGRAASEAQVRFIGLTCGGTTEADLREAGAVQVFDSPGHLLAHWPVQV